MNIFSYFSKGIGYIYLKFFPNCLDFLEVSFVILFWSCLFILMVGLLPVFFCLFVLENIKLEQIGPFLKGKTELVNCDVLNGDPAIHEKTLNESSFCSKHSVFLNTDYLYILSVNI